MPESSAEVVVTVVAGRRPPVLRIGYSFGFCAYQVVIALGSGRDAAVLGLPRDPVWAAVAERVRPVCSPLGTLSYVEEALIETTGPADLERRASARAAQLAGLLSGAVTAVDAAYRRVWATHRELLDTALRELVELVRPRRDCLLDELSQALGTGSRSAEHLVTLVPVCHVPVGGYSHPTVLDVSVFRGTQLVEALVHELAHVFAAAGRDAAGSCYELFRAAVRGRGYAEPVAAELFHVLVFRLSALLVTRAGWPDHHPIGTARGVYDRAARRLGVALDPTAVHDGLSGVLDGRLVLPDAVHLIAASLPDRG